ncbi:hypothetical protein [Streptomyces sp. NPDC048603]|uniref:hypothetical protein n=1 Tax=Streptomyces sp. NPDC048603 TaxID=3365577 RepID=UPI003710FBD3
MDDRTKSPSKGLAQIILALSPADGLVVVPLGEQYRWANTALQLTPGFKQRPDGTYALRDVDTAAPILLALADTARRHRVHLFGGPRPYLGDYAAALANGVPGEWTVKVEVYAHPVWQEDLVPLLWDAGELIASVEHARIPYGAELTSSAGIELLLVERPGSAHEYLLGSFASTPFDDNYADPHAPRAVVLPSDTARAASLVTGTFLPAYEQAVHERLLAAVEAGQARLEELHGTWAVIDASGRYTDGTPLDQPTLSHIADQYLVESAREFRHLRPHAAQLLNRIDAVTGMPPEDAAALARLRKLLPIAAPQAMWPAPLAASPPRLLSASAEEVRRWRVDAPALLRQARALRPPRPEAVNARTALPAAAKALPAPATGAPRTR